MERLRRSLDQTGAKPAKTRATKKAPKKRTRAA
jgi:hypothetical protein